MNMQEYAVASAILFAMLETSACETAQRVTGALLRVVFVRWGVLSGPLDKSSAGLLYYLLVFRYLYI